MELDFYAAWSTGQVASCAACELLGEEARGGCALGLDGGGAGFPLFWGQAAVDGTSFAAGGGEAVTVYFLFTIFTENVGGSCGVFEGWEGRDGPTWREMVELLYVVVIAEFVGPPPGHEVKTLAVHAGEEIPAFVCGAGKLDIFFFGRKGGGSGVRKRGGGG